jgi:hypothetical protein
MYKSDSTGSSKDHHQKTQKHYKGKRSYGECFVTVNNCALDPRFDLRFHSPDGFEWGYSGSGPAQLALALLADWLRDDSKALRLHQEFKRRTVAGFSKEGWSLTGKEIDETLNTLENDAPK